jgi:hypothetical protein
MGTASALYCISMTSPVSATGGKPELETLCENWGKEPHEGQACRKLSMKGTALQLAQNLLMKGAASQAAEKLLMKGAASQAAKKPCFVSGHDFRRAVNRAPDEGFSP